MHHHVTFGTILGALISFLANIGPDLVHTGILALFGATVSFLVSLGWIWVFTKWKSRKDSKLPPQK